MVSPSRSKWAAGICNCPGAASSGPTSAGPRLLAVDEGDPVYKYSAILPLCVRGFSSIKHTECWWSAWAFHCLCVCLRESVNYSRSAFPLLTTVWITSSPPALILGNRLHKFPPSVSLLCFFLLKTAPPTRRPVWGCDRNSLYISQSSAAWYTCSRGNETACVLCALSWLRQLCGCWGRVNLQRWGSWCALRWCKSSSLDQNNHKIWMFRQHILPGPLCVICIILQGITSLKLLFVLHLSVALNPPTPSPFPSSSLPPDKWCHLHRQEQTTGILKQAFMPLWSFFWWDLCCPAALLRLLVQVYLYGSLAWIFISFSRASKNLAQPGSPRHFPTNEVHILLERLAKFSSLATP